MAKEESPTKRQCATDLVHERLLRTVPGYREARDASENYAWRAAFGMGGRAGCTRIPVVVHVVHKTAAQNISDAQIKSQIQVLNADFRKKNADVASVPAAFESLAADARIEFELATKDPDGNDSDGIDRVSTTKDSFTHDDAVKSAATGGADPWPSDRYLNIWVCQLSGGLLGYAQFPGGPPDTDGVVILHSAFGTSGTAAAPFNLGRTTTHEVGHWLNLRHIWGDDGTGCSGSDYVADTPNQGGPNYGTPTFPKVSCGNGPNGDMFMNYMDYVDDVAMFMFSEGQVTRMQAALDGSRSGIGTAFPCGKGLPGKEFPKDPIKEWPKDPPKEWLKELPKDPPKDWHKDPPKDWPKDPPKDWHKDPPKDLPKDWPKDPFGDPKLDPGPKGLDPGPKIHDPGPKVYDPGPKLTDPGPKTFDPPKGMDPGPLGPGVPGGGGVPFVLATPAAQGAPARAEIAPLAAGYLQLMTQYAQLHARGMLDQSGLAAWHEAAMAYQRLLSGQST